MLAGACMQGAVEQAFPASSGEDEEARGSAGAEYLDCIVQALTLQSKTLTEASAAIVPVGRSASVCLRQSAVLADFPTSLSCCFLGCATKNIILLRY